MVNDFGFRQKRAIDQAVLSMNNPNNQSQQDILSALLGSPEAVNYANSAMARYAAPAQQRPYDGPGVTMSTPTGGVGGYGTTPDILSQLWGDQMPSTAMQPIPNGNGGGMQPIPLAPPSGLYGTLPLGQSAPNLTAPTIARHTGTTNVGTPASAGPAPYPTYTGSQPQTYGILNPSDFGFGFGNGVPGGDVVQWLQDAGFPDVNLIQAIQQGQVPGRTNVAQAAQQLGGIGLPSPQLLERLGPSGFQFLMGLYSTMLGIPEEDLIYGSLSPFMGLGQAQGARQVGGYIR